MNRMLLAAMILGAIVGFCLVTGACTSKSVSGSIDEAAPAVSSDNSDKSPATAAAASITTLPVSLVEPSAAQTPTLTLNHTPTPTPIPSGSDHPESTKVISIPVLNYHSIGDDPDSTLILHPDKFASQMDYLAEYGYTPLSISDFMLILEKRKPAPPKPVLLTFDDGYVDNYELAMPVLKSHGFPATLFISPGVVGHEAHLNWEQVKEMKEAGWDIEPHGMTHPHLPQLSEAKQKEEITEARRQIEERLGTKADVFCYPFGEYNQQTLKILKEEGFRYAFTILQGMTTSSQPPLQLKRIYVNAQESLSQWSKKLSA